MSRGLGKSQQLVKDRLHANAWLTIYDVRRILARAEFAKKGEGLPSLFGALDSGRVTEDITSLRYIYRLMRSLERRKLALRIRIRPAAWTAIRPARKKDEFRFVDVKKLWRQLPSRVMLRGSLPCSLNGIPFDVAFEKRS